MKNTIIKTLKNKYIGRSADAGGTTIQNQQKEHAAKAKVPASSGFRMHPLQVWASPHFFYYLSSLNDQRA